MLRILEQAYADLNRNLGVTFEIIVLPAMLLLLGAPALGWLGLSGGAVEFAMIAVGVLLIALMMAGWLRWRVLDETPRLQPLALLRCLGALLGVLVAALAVAILLAVAVLLAEIGLGWLLAGDTGGLSARQSYLISAAVILGAVTFLPLYWGLRLAPALLTAATGTGPGPLAAWRQTRPLRGTALRVALAFLALGMVPVGLVLMAPMPVVQDLAMILILLLWIATLPAIADRAAAPSRAEIFA